MKIVGKNKMNEFNTSKVKSAKKNKMLRNSLSCTKKKKKKKKYINDDGSPIKN